jgi:adenine-specific DNA-methyltransferase
MSERNKSKSIRTPNSIKKRARELRKAATPAETILWNQLRNRRLNGIKFRRQHPLGSYIVDLYCPAHRLVVEIDGEIHRYQGVNDQTRTDQLEEKGYKVIRFWNYEVEHHLGIVLDTIAENCDLPSPSVGRRACPEGSEGAGDEGNN